MTDQRGFDPAPLGRRLLARSSRLARAGGARFSAQAIARHRNPTLGRRPRLLPVHDTPSRSAGGHASSESAPMPIEPPAAAPSVALPRPDGISEEAARWLFLGELSPSMLPMSALKPTPPPVARKLSRSAVRRARIEEGPSSSASEGPRAAAPPSQARPIEDAPGERVVDHGSNAGTGPANLGEAKDAAASRPPAEAAGERAEDPAQITTTLSAPARSRLRANAPLSPRPTSAGSPPVDASIRSPGSARTSRFPPVIQRSPQANDARREPGGRRAKPSGTRAESARAGPEPGAPGVAGQARDDGVASPDADKAEPTEAAGRPTPARAPDEPVAARAPDAAPKITGHREISAPAAREPGAGSARPLSRLRPAGPPRTVARRAVSANLEERGSIRHREGGAYAAGPARPAPGRPPEAPAAATDGEAAWPGTDTTIEPAPKP